MRLANLWRRVARRLTMLWTRLEPARRRGRAMFQTVLARILRPCYDAGVQKLRGVWRRFRGWHAQAALYMGRGARCVVSAMRTVASFPRRIPEFVFWVARRGWRPVETITLKKQLLRVTAAAMRCRDELTREVGHLSV